MNRMLRLLQGIRDEIEKQDQPMPAEVRRAFDVIEGYICDAGTSCCCDCGCDRTNGLQLVSSARGTMHCLNCRTGWHKPW